ncbi:MAG: substrate-binding periplasmic protein, partial [Acidimicrobiales bacterium]
VGALALMVVGLAGCATGDGKEGQPAGAGAPTTSSSTVPSGPPAVDTVKGDALTACLDVPNAPFAFEEQGQVAGVDADLMRAVGGRLALAAELVDIDRQALFAALIEGRCDVGAASLPTGSDLPDGLIFSDAYFTVEQSLAVRAADGDRFGDLASLRTARIGVRSASVGAGYARAKAPGATVVEFPTADALIAALVGGQVEGAVQDFPDNAFHATTTGQTVVVTTFPDAGKRQYALVLADDDPALVAAVNGALAQVRSDDTVPTVLRRYLGGTTGQTSPGP